jgi:glycosyltransferase involved in cell wall biosynthesis
MNYYIVIPAHNEEAFLAKTLDSIVQQTLLPKKVIIVNDHSTDNTEGIIDRYIVEYGFIRKVNTAAAPGLHLPGSKVINAFNVGLGHLDEEYDFIVKLDADLILPAFYFEKIAGIFKAHPAVGIAGGQLHEQDAHGRWKLYHPMNRNHIRGAFKSYSKKCFKTMGGLKNAMGWDTLDELLAQFYGFELYTDENLTVKHLRPVGMAYSDKARFLQGVAMYRMRYGFRICAIASLKMAWKKGKPMVFIDNMRGYLKAKKEKLPFLVTGEQGVFIRQLRWRNISRKLF